MNISSNCFYHFTKKKNLLSILSEKRIYASYCKEHVLLDTYIGVPMVSFCDIPLMQGVSNPRYGKYAIGMKREWALSRKLNPVFYINQESNLKSLLGNSFISAAFFSLEANRLEAIANTDNTPPSSISEAIKRSQNNNTTFAEFSLKFNSYIQCYIKNSEIKEAYGGSKIPKNYKFYNEREWRFVPKIEENLFSFISKDEYDVWKGSGKSKPILEDHFLEFTLDDIDHIVISRESEFNQFISQPALSDYANIGYKFEFMDKIRENF